MTQRKLEFKPLLYTTTMRNPERLKFMLYILAKFTNRILDNSLAIEIVAETIKYGLYRPLNKTNTIKEKWKSTPSGVFAEYLLNDEEVSYVIKNNPQKHKEAGFDWGYPSRFATIYDLIKELGLAYYTPNKPIIISELGNHLLKSLEVTVNEKENTILYEVTMPEYEQQVFIQAMAKSQRKNPFVRVLNDNIPLILLLQTIKLLNSDKNQNNAGISRREIPLLLFWKNNNANELYKRIVKLRKEFGYNPSDEIIIDICINEIMEGNYKKFDSKSIMVDYIDEFIRKMRITGLISLRGAGRFIDINKKESEKVEYIIDKYSDYQYYTDELRYFEHIAKLDTQLIQIQTKDSTGNDDLLEEWLQAYMWCTIKEELEILSSGKTTKDSVLKLLPAPSRLEFLTALAIKSKMPEIKVHPNYSCDDTGLPTSTAGGNKGDIECMEKKNGILVEVTMATGRTQTMMEVWPIERHLKDFSKDKNAQCVFIAPSIFNDSKRQIEFLQYDTKGDINIRPYTINDFIEYLETNSNLYKYKELSSVAASPVSPYGTNN